MAQAEHSDSDIDEIDCTANQPPKPNKDETLPALFWDRLDEEYESVDAAALRALKEESTPEELAEDAKRMGNEHLAMGIKIKKKFYIQEAVQQYNRGLSEPIRDNKLKSILHANRAQAHIFLQNWGNALKDAKDAVRFDPSNIKAYYRGARAANKLSKFHDAISICQQGLAAQPGSAELKEQLVTAKKGVQQQEAEIAAKVAQEHAKREPARQLAQALLRRGWRIGRPQFSVQGRKPSVDAEGIVHWPMLFMYPQSMTNDVVEDVREDHAISEHLDAMFGPGAPVLEWDTDGAYTRDSLDMFYLTHGATPLTEEQLTEALHGGWPPDFKDEGPQSYGKKAAKWKRVNEKWTLAELFNKKDYVVPGIPVVFVVARGTAFYERFMESVEL